MTTTQPEQDQPAAPQPDPTPDPQRDDPQQDPQRPDRDE